VKKCRTTWLIDVRLLASEPRMSATVLQTVGSKGYDGIAVAVVVS
jgi:hypothetical protein